MTAITQAVQLRCDWCHALSPERLLAESGIIVETPVPDGWTAIGYGAARSEPAINVRLTDPFGNAITHLCPDCSRRPAGDLITYLGTIPKEAKI